MLNVFARLRRWLRKDRPLPRSWGYDATNPIELGPWPTRENTQFSLTDAQKDAANRLQTAMQVQDSELVLDGITRAYRAGLHPIHVPLLFSLADAPWHSSHEDIVFALQQLRNPAAVAILEKIAFSIHKYLDYDENFGFARKCTWALADIGNPEAHQALTRIADCKNPIIAGYARKRLDNWEEELDRKGI